MGRTAAHFFCLSLTYGVDIQAIVKQVETDLRLVSAPCRYLFSKMPYITQTAKDSPSLSDDLYLPAYYYLGKSLKPTHFIDLTFAYGMAAGAVVMGAENVTHILGYQSQAKDVFYSPQMGIHNLRNVSPRTKVGVSYGDLFESAFQSNLARFSWPLVIINEILTYDEYLKLLSTIWPHVSEGGVVTIDHVLSDDAPLRALEDFSRVNRREFTLIRSRYGIGVLAK